MRKQVVSLIAATFLMAPQVLAAGTWQNRTYDATFSMYSPSTQGSFRIAADGRGHSIVDSKVTQGHSLMIVDAPNKTTFMITEAQGHKMAMKMPYKEASKYATTSEDIRRRNGVPLGTKVIAGHPCHGYKYNDRETGVTETWLGDDIDFMVETITNAPTEGQTKLTLQTFSASAPPAGTFTLPAGVKIMDMGAIGGGDFSSFGGPKLPPEAAKYMRGGMPSNIQLPPGVKLPQGIQLPQGMQMPSADSDSE